MTSNSAAQKRQKKFLPILKKILPILLKNPDCMWGHDTSLNEIEEIKDKNKIPLYILENLGGDHFFLIHAAKFGLRQRDGDELDFYLERELRDNLNNLTKNKIFDYIDIEEIQS